MWPAPLHHLVQAHGADAVWYTGLDALGFPPTWVNTGSEIAAVRRALETGTKGTPNTFERKAG